ncbi:hypothetical protein [Novosphingobium sp. 11B]
MIPTAWGFPANLASFAVIRAALPRAGRVGVSPDHFAKSPPITCIYKGIRKRAKIRVNVDAID